ncbi:hypothetical protein CJF31_00000652 [Rutstroemia sp. NJR-2017a BVV2]|nr:hypothetical protein CJF31_00000652 [Rutstroemia sp. NJR-2017a BVV2]
MAKCTIYTRVYSESSAGQLVSGRTPRGESLSHADVLDEFRIHSDKDNREPTALVSVSVRIVDTLTRAFYKHHMDDEPAGDIWFVFIEVPINTTPDSGESGRIHSARSLADDCGLPMPQLFTYERVFEWAIPEEYVLQKVSLQTLMSRGLTWELLTGSDPHTQYLSTSSLRGHIAENLRDGFWDAGMYLGFLAKTFGARAPVEWICDQVFNDCVKISGLDIFDGDRVMVEYMVDSEREVRERPEIVDVEVFRDMDDAIDLVLFEWWLRDDIFLSKREEYEEWQAWEEIALWETYHVVGLDEIVGELSEEDKARYEREHKTCAAQWENQAVKLGL